MSHKKPLEQRLSHSESLSVSQVETLALLQLGQTGLYYQQSKKVSQIGAGGGWREGAAAAAAACIRLGQQARDSTIVWETLTEPHAWGL